MNRIQTPGGIELIETPRPNGVGMEWTPVGDEPIDFRSFVEAYGLKRFSDDVNDRIAVVVNPTKPNPEDWGIQINGTQDTVLYGGRAIHEDSNAPNGGSIQVTLLSHAPDDDKPRCYNTMAAPRATVQAVMAASKELLNPDKHENLGYSRGYLYSAYKRLCVDVDKIDPTSLSTSYGLLKQLQLHNLIPLFNAFYAQVESMLDSMLDYSLNDQPRSVLCMGNLAAYHWARPNGRTTQRDSFSAALIESDYRGELAWTFHKHC